MSEKVIRCAIYTRKSVEEGLDQEFNSLDAQRMACESYIAAKRFEGWQLIPTHYDDGGFSGGNMNRPAFKQLRDDIRAGKIDMVVCYKIDRLSRSIADFSGFIAELDECHASFVSVTQEFNTSTSMGRMVLNLLMTFAQFEREIISERVADKVAQSRRLGYWTGGYVPYGYKRVDKKLVPDPQTAPNVRKMFEWYVHFGTPKLVSRRLKAEGILRFPEKGIAWNTVMVATALRNCVYAGKVPYKDEQFDGQHEAIIPAPLWEKAQALLNAAAKQPPHIRRTNSPALLTGLMRCGHCGDALSHTWTAKAKNGSRYAYYTCRKDQRRAVSTCPIRAIPAQVIEPVIEAHMLKILRTPENLPGLAEANHCTVPEMERQLLAPEAFWTSLSPVGKRELLQTYIEKITVYHGTIEIKAKKSNKVTVIPIDFKTIHGRRRCVVVGEGEVSDVDRDETNGLLKTFARARLWTRILEQGDFASVKELAEDLGIDRAYVVKTLRLANLSPRIIRAAIRKELPDGFSLEKLWKTKSDIWEDQEKELGFA